jgi:hypothetical protein
MGAPNVLMVSTVCHPWLVGGYRYGGCEIDGVHYSIIYNGAIIERVRVLQPDGNPIIWRCGDTLTEMIIRIIAAC